MPHALLRIGAGTVVISDTPAGMPVALGSNVHVCLDFDDPAETTERFDALAAGGEITMPLQHTFWGAKFGMVTDLRHPLDVQRHAEAGLRLRRV